MFVNGPLVRFRITFLLFETSLMITISGGASTPLSPTDCEATPQDENIAS